MNKETRVYKIVIIILALIIIGGGIMIYKISNANEEQITQTIIKNEHDENEEIQFIISEADKSAQQDKYEKAINIIEEGIEKHPNNNILQDKLMDYQYLNDTKIKDKALNDADALVQNQGDYLGAIHLLEKIKTSIGEDFEDVNDRFSEYKNYYISELSEMINEEINNENFDDAEKLVKEAIKELPDEQQLFNEKLNEIENLRPQYLLDIIEPYEKPYYYKKFGGETFKMAGTEYKQGFTCMGYGDQDKGNLTYFNIQGKNYKEISFTAGFVDGTANADVVTFRTIVDGNVVDAFDVHMGDLPVRRTIELPENASQLVLSVDSHRMVAMYDSVYGLANLTVQ